MANKNSKIKAFTPSGNFTEQEKTTLFLALTQILTNQDRIMKNMDLGTPEKDEEFCNEDNNIMVSICYELLANYGIPVDDDDDDNEE